jgi:hypothetical protein
MYSGNTRLDDHSRIMLVQFGSSRRGFDTLTIPLEMDCYDQQNSTLQ